MIKHMVLVLADPGVQIPAPLLTSWVTLVITSPAQCCVPSLKMG